MLALALCTTGTKALPSPPCPSPTEQLFGAVDAPPQIHVWFPDNEHESWHPPACTQWKGDSFSVLVETSGRFRHQGGAETIAERFGKISALPTIRYWSVTRQHWRPLISAAHALRTVDPRTKREDFRYEELNKGQEVYFRQKENTPAGEVIYRLHLRETTPERLVIEAENAAPVERFWLPLFKPGGYQFLYWIEHETGDAWRYYSLMRATAEIDIGITGQEESYINRAAALFRYATETPTDKEPPAAPGNASR